MKILKAFYPVLAAGIIFSMLAVACGNSKKTAVPCPDFSKSRSYRSGHKEIGKNPSIYFAQRKTVKNHRPAYQLSEVTSGNHQGQLLHLSGLQPLPAHNRMAGEYVLIQAKQGEIQNSADVAGVFPVAFAAAPASDNMRHLQYIEGKIVAGDSIVDCDTVVFKAGNILVAKVIEIGLNEIKYRECENLAGPLISILKSDVFVIKYPNGTRDYFDQVAPVIQTETTNKTIREPAHQKSEGMGTAGFIASLLGFFIAGIPLGIFAIIAGSVSIGKINRHPGKYKGKGLAIASIIIGLVDVVGVLLLLSSM
ncbi:MAG: DUF4190 domain-containing protein [Bacteroidales bacterium]